MSSPNCSHAQVFALPNAIAALRLACRYLPSASGATQSKKTQYNSFFCLTASLCACGHLRIWVLPPWPTPTSLWPQHWLTQNVVHLDSRSPTSPGTWLKLFRRWKLKLLLTDSSRPNRPSQYVWVCQVLGGSSPTTSSNWTAGGDWLTAPPLSSPGCPGHVAANPMTWPLSQSLHCSLRCPGVKCTYEAFFGWRWCSLWTICDEQRSPTAKDHLGLDEGGHAYQLRPSRCHCHYQCEHLSHPEGWEKMYSPALLLRTAKMVDTLSCCLGRRHKQQSGAVPPPKGGGKLSSCSPG